MKNIFSLFFIYVKNFFWAKINPITYAKSIGVKVGSHVRIFSLHPGAFGSEPYLITIGDNTVITARVRFITHDGTTFLFRKTYPDLDVMGPISIGNNTFIGMGSVILPGVSIGDNCVVGAMSVVTKSVPEGSVVAGNPARVLGKTDELLNKMLERSSGTGSLSPTQKREQLMLCERSQDESNRIWLVWHNKKYTDDQIRTTKNENS